MHARTRRTAVALLVAAAAGLATASSALAVDKPAGTLRLGPAGPTGSLQTFEWGLTNSSTLDAGGGMSAGKTDLGAFKVQKAVDGLSVPLMQAAGTGAQIPRVDIEVLSTVGSPFTLSYRLEHVLVTSVQQRGDGDGAGVGEAVTLRYATIHVSVGTASFDFTL